MYIKGMFPYHQSDAVHVTSFTLKITSWESVQSFYLDVLGFQVLSNGKEIVLSLDGKHGFIHLIEGGLPVESPTLGLYHMALLLPKRDQLSAIIHRIIAHRYPVSGLSDHGVSEALYISDTDGHGFELYVDRPSQEWPMKKGQLDMYTKAADVRSIMNLTNVGQGLPPETIVGHGHFHVSDLTEARAYYEQVFGFIKQVDYGDTATFLGSKGYHHHLGLNTWLPEGMLRTPQQIGLVGYHVHVPDVAIFLKHLNKLQIAVLKEGDQHYFFDFLNQKVTF